MIGGQQSFGAVGSGRREKSRLASQGRDHATARLGGWLAEECQVFFENQAGTAEMGGGAVAPVSRSSRLLARIDKA